MPTFQNLLEKSKLYNLTKLGEKIWTEIVKMRALVKEEAIMDQLSWGRIVTALQVFVFLCPRCCLFPNGIRQACICLTIFRPKTLGRSETRMCSGEIFQNMPTFSSLLQWNLEEFLPWLAVKWFSSPTDVTRKPGFVTREGGRLKSIIFVLTRMF